MQVKVIDELREKFHHLSPTEKKVARFLMNNYPLAGLETIAQIAKRSQVSGPTVLRFINKLGFDGFSNFQEALRQELEIQLVAQEQSPILRRDPNQKMIDHEYLGDFATNINRLVLDTANSLLPEDFDMIVDWLSNPKFRVWLIGGYITGPLAEYFSHHLQSIRGKVSELRSHPSTWADTLIDMNKNDVIVVFDIRRYWQELEPMLELALTKKIKIVLITDQWVSPLSKIAQITLTAHTEGKSGWDTNVAVLFLIDALIAAINNKDWEQTKKRLQQIETMRNHLRQKH